MNIEDMSIEEATERCKALTNPEQGCWIGTSNQKAIETVLSELEKKEAIINEMAKELSKLNYLQYCNANNCDYPPCNKERCIKQYFEKKVEGK